MMATCREFQLLLGQGKGSEDRVGYERACRIPDPRTKPDMGGGGGSGSGAGATFFGRASKRVMIISSFARWNLGVPGATPVAATTSLVTSSAVGKCFWK